MTKRKNHTQKRQEKKKDPKTTQVVKNKPSLKRDLLLTVFTLAVAIDNLLSFDARLEKINALIPAHTTASLVLYVLAIVLVLCVSAAAIYNIIKANLWDKFKESN